MGLREIPASFEHACDSCGTKLVKPSNARPKFWSDLTLAQEAYDYQGSTVADGTIKLRLCRGCTTRIVKAINEISDDERSKRQEPQP